MSQDTFSPSARQAPSGGGAASGRASVDRLELKQQWAQQIEAQQVEEALNLYAKAARQRMQSGVPDVPQPLDEEALEAMSQELKLRQMCQDIAALIMVDGLEDDLDEEEG